MPLAYDLTRLFEIALGAMAMLLVALAVSTWRLRRRAQEARRATVRDAERQAAELAAHADMETALQRAKEAAEAANAAKTRYLVAVSHEIRSPLNAIYGYAQLLERDGGIPPQEAGGVIRRSAEHLTNLVEGLLEISRIESGVLKVRTDVVQLPVLLDHVLDMFRMQAAAKGIELRYEIKGRLPRFVRTDEKRLRQILINLLSNAIKYTREGSATLSIAYRSQVAEVDIVDTGIGIAPDDLERIFEPFERGSLPEAALQPGIGLGLAITRVLARILGGELAVTSVLGEGSRFRLSLFLPEPFTPPGDAAEYNRVVGYDGPRRTVLVIDDQPSQIVVIDNLLRRLGFIIHAAPNGMEGLAMAERYRPDLVLLDIQMPGISGWEVAERLRAAHGEGLRIVLVSANAHEVANVSDNAAHHDAYVSKPVDLESLVTVIGRELKLAWQIGDGDRPHEAGAPPEQPLPPAAGPMLAEIRRLAKVGHIRGVDAALVELDAKVPGAGPAVAAMRDHVRNFDLRSLIKLLDGQQSP
jgi:signal transduction histidine kinase/CheY-like chemotaxis protein